MSHHSSINEKLPTNIDLRQQSNDAPMFQRNTETPLSTDLLIKGQGCIVFGIPETDPQKRPQEVNISFSTKNEEYGVLLHLNQEGANFQCIRNGKAENFTLKNEDKKIIVPADGYSLGIDSNPKCIYWLSIDSLNKRLRFGKGEMRFSTRLLDYQYDFPKNLFTKEDPLYPEIDNLKHFTASTEIELLSLWKDPLVNEPPSHVVPSEEYTMDDAAAANKYTTAKALSEECQLLYANVKDFELNTPDFPDFGQAIEHSVRTKGCLGYRILQEKLINSPFNADPNQAKSEEEYKEVYLRITLGQSQGESPGIPYVMEIWPAGCASPIHHHGYTHAIIKVLRGAIDVDIYRMLPGKNDPEKALKTVTFNPKEVTYLMPEANQYHLLKNNLNKADTCITIQCYSYGKKDTRHYPTFDYIEDKEVDHFDPISDCDFIAFKAEIRKEWDEYLRTRPWLGKEILDRED